MKKKIRLISAVLLCAMLISACVSLSSCGNVNGDEIWKKIDEAMTALSSYEAEVSMNMIFYIDGNKVTGTGEGILIESGSGDADDYYFYQSLRTDVVSKALEIDESVRNIEAYNEGNYFIYQHNLGGKSKKLSGAMAVEDFVKYIESKGSMGIDVTKSKSAKISRNKGGTQSITYSEFPKSAVEKAIESFGIDEEMFKFNIKDISVTITYDKDFLVTLMEYDFIFDIYEKAKNKPSVNIKIEYSNFNEAERVYTNINPQQYTVLEHINILNKIEMTLEEKKNATDNTFYIDAHQNAHSGGQSSSYSERDTVNYGVKGGKYYYDITADIGGNEVEVSYSDGKQIVKTGSVSQENEQTEEEAREYINGLIDGARFRKLNVISIEKQVDPEAVNEEIYVIKLDDFDQTPYQQIIAQLGIGSYNNIKHTIRVQFLNGELRLLEGAITINNYSLPIEVSINSSNRFMPLSAE